MNVATQTGFPPNDDCDQADLQYCENPLTVNDNQISDNYVYDHLHSEAVYLGVNVPASNYPSNASEQNANILYSSFLSL